MSCDNMLCRMNKDINEDPMYWLGASLFSGVLFSTWSWGIVYLLFFTVFYEVIYFVVCKYRIKTPYNAEMRIGMIAGSIFGFLIGRAITETDDHQDCISEFISNAKYYLNIK